MQPVQQFAVHKTVKLLKPVEPFWVKKGIYIFGKFRPRLVSSPSTGRLNEIIVEGSDTQKPMDNVLQELVPAIVVFMASRSYPNIPCPHT